MSDFFAVFPAELHNKAASAAALLSIVMLLVVTGRMPLLRVILLLPSTFLHELCHLIVAFVTGGGPSGFSIIPQRHRSHAMLRGLRTRWVLGSVTLSRPGFFSCFPTGFAPLSLLPLAWWLSQTPVFPDSAAGIFTRLAFVVVIAGGAIPSRQDVAVAFSRIGGAVFYCSVIAAGLLFFLAK